MKTVTFTKLIAFVLVGLPCFGQTWTALTGGTSLDVWSTSFVSTTNGWVSGANGMIMNTTDGGATWAAQTSGVSTPILRNITMFNQNNGWALGDQGTILHTTNGGANWTAQTSGTTQTLRQATFINASTGWICGGNGTILHTTDGGANWTAQTTGTIIGLMNIHFTDANNGWAVGTSGGVTMGIILHTSNGGANWSQQTAPNSTNLNSCNFISSSLGWAAGNTGTVFHTVDGGNNWTVQNTGNINNFRSIFFASATEGWAVDDAGGIYATNNGGSTWNSQSSGTTQIFRGMTFVNSNRGYAVGNAGTIIEYNMPVLNNSASINPFSTILGTASSSQSFTVSATYIPSNLTITAPTDFEVSLAAGSGFGSSVSITPVLTNIASTTVYVRYNPSAVGNNSGNISISTNGATTQTIALNGTCASSSTPNITASNIGSAFSTTVGTPSATQTITVSGLNLTTNMDLTAPADFEISLFSGSGFSQNFSLSPTAGTVSLTTVYVRYNPAAAGNHSGNISIVSNGAVTQNIPVSGTSTLSGLSELVDDNEIQVFPNPGTGIFELLIPNFNSGDRLSIYGSDGKIILQEEVSSSQHHIDLTTVQSGIYFVRLSQDDHTSIRKISLFK